MDDRWRLAWDAKCILGEGPVWHAGEGTLYFVDIKGRWLHWLRLGDGTRGSWPTPCRVGSVAPARSGGLIAGTEQGFARIDPAGGLFDLIDHPERDRPTNRFNDGKVDPAGRFWAGTMDDSEQDDLGALYRLDQDLAWSRHDDGYRVTNGPAFSPDGRTMYHSDSAKRMTYAYPVNDDGSLGERRVFAHFTNADGYPDGMTVDADGFVWIAFWDGWAVRRIDGQGRIVDERRLPVQRPTSACFAGPDLDRLFVTSARVGLNDEALDHQPFAGALFEVETGVRGAPVPPFAG